MKWFWHKRKPQPNACECGHAECYHWVGLRYCDKPFCNCKRFIRATADPQDARELEQLRKMAGLK